MLETSAREVEIVDVRLPIFFAFLEYLYTEEVAADKKDEYMELYVVADQLYVVADRVRGLCVFFQRVHGDLLFVYDPVYGGSTARVGSWTLANASS